MSRFKDRLWSDLVRAHGADLNQISRSTARSGSRPRILAGTGAGLAAAGAAVAVVLVTAGTMPAFAVTQNHDGSVTVSISRVQGIRGANAKLEALGYRVRVVQVAVGCEGRGARWARIQGRAAPPPGNFRSGARFDPRQIPAGRVLVIPAWSSGRTVSIHRGPVIAGQAPACLPMQGAPAAGSPPPPGGPGQRLACCPGPGGPPLMGPHGRHWQQAPAPPCPSLWPSKRQRHIQVVAGRPHRNISGSGGTWPQALSVSCPAPAHGHGRHWQRKHH
jgi:hypothetical protein